MTKPPYPTDLQDKFMLRLPDGMRDAIRTAAEANKRSMNSEIVARLARSLEMETVHVFDDPEDANRALEGFEAMADRLAHQIQRLEEVLKGSDDVLIPVKQRLEEQHDDLKSMTRTMAPGDKKRSAT